MATSPDFAELSLFFVVPLCILLGCWLIQKQWKMRLYAGIYRPLFGCMLGISFVLLGYANRVQSLVYAHLRGRQRHYPVVGVTLCWIAALTGIAFHLHALLGGAKWFRH